MAFRSKRYSELCGMCRKPARAKCLRCDKPLCIDHVPRRDTRCDACEAEFKESILQRESWQADDLQRRIRGSSIMSYVSVVALTGVWLKSAAKYAAYRVGGQTRREFLAERKNKG